VLQRALKSLDHEAIEDELASVTRELHDATGSRHDSLTRTRDALLAQGRSYERIASVWEDARNKLQVLNAQLDEAVARAVELSLSSNEASDVSPLAGDVDNLVNDLEALRQGLEALDQPATG
jgi:NADH dehydrogenase/NADH:ubiquinone oxidoreductase subunit G